MDDWRKLDEHQPGYRRDRGRLLGAQPGPQRAGHAGLRLRYLCDLDVERARACSASTRTVRRRRPPRRGARRPGRRTPSPSRPRPPRTSSRMAALEAGKHVLVEKPLAATFAEGQELVEEADRRGLVLMLDHTYCYTPAVRLPARAGARRRARRAAVPRLGAHQPRAGAARRRRRSGTWRRTTCRSSTSILPDGRHAGRGLRARRPTRSAPVGPASAYLTLQLSTGAIAHIHVNWLSPTKIRTTVIGGSTRTVVWDDLNPLQRLSVYDRGVDLAATRRAGRRRARRDDRLLPHRRHGRPGAARARKRCGAMMAEFATAITRAPPPLTDGRSGLRVLAMLEAASAASPRVGASCRSRLTA